MKPAIGLQVCRPHKLSSLVAALADARTLLGCQVHLVVDRPLPAVRSILDASSLPYMTTNGIGNWTSKNVLLRACMAGGADYAILLEDDIEILELGLFEYLFRAYDSARQLLGLYKLNTIDHRFRHAKDFLGEVTFGDVRFEKLATFNTSALLVIDRRMVDKIGYFCNSYYEVGFYDYRDRLRQVGLVSALLSPASLRAYVRVDDDVPSTIPKSLRPKYRSQVFPDAPDGYRPFNDRPAMVIDAEAVE